MNKAGLQDLHRGQSYLDVGSTACTMCTFQADSIYSPPDTQTLASFPAPCLAHPSPHSALCYPLWKGPQLTSSVMRGGREDTARHYSKAPCVAMTCRTCKCMARSCPCAYLVFAKSKERQVKSTCSKDKSYSPNSGMKRNVFP